MPGPLLDLGPAGPDGRRRRRDRPAPCVFRRIRTGVPKIIGQGSEDIRTVVGAKRRSGRRVKKVSELSQVFSGCFRATGTMRFEPRGARSAVPNGGSAAAGRTPRPPGRGPRRSAWGPVGGRAPVAGTRTSEGQSVRRSGRGEATPPAGDRAVATAAHHPRNDQRRRAGPEPPQAAAPPAQDAY